MKASLRYLVTTLFIISKELRLTPIPTPLKLFYQFLSFNIKNNSYIALLNQIMKFDGIYRPMKILRIFISVLPMCCFGQTFVKVFTQGDTITLDGYCYTSWNIFFEYNKPDINSKSAMALLDSLAVFLIKNDNLMIEVGVHRAIRGNEEFYGKNLTQERANTVRNYLVKNGVQSRRLVGKGYGTEKPLIVEPKTESEHSMNQRIEFKIIKNPFN